MRANMGESGEILLEDLEGLLREINDFCAKVNREAPEEIPQSLERYFCYVARSGNTVFPWQHVRPLFRSKILQAMGEFPGEVCPNNELFVLERFDMFRSAPFTIQRLTELITQPTRHYKKKEKFLRGLEKAVLVVTTIEPWSVDNDAKNGNDNFSDGEMDQTYSESDDSIANRSYIDHESGMSVGGIEIQAVQPFINATLLGDGGGSLTVVERISSEYITVVEPVHTESPPVVPGVRETVAEVSPDKSSLPPEEASPPVAVLSTDAEPAIPLLTTEDESNSLPSSGGPEPSSDLITEPGIEIEPVHSFTEASPVEEDVGSLTVVERISSEYITIIQSSPTEFLPVVADVTENVEVAEVSPVKSSEESPALSLSTDAEAVIPLLIPEDESNSLPPNGPEPSPDLDLVAEPSLDKP